MLRRVGASEDRVLGTQGNIAVTYEALGRLDESHRMFRDVYFGRLKFSGEENFHTLSAANNYASSLLDTNHEVEEAKSVLKRTLLVARRVLGEVNEITLYGRWNYARALYNNDNATLDDIREAVNTLEDLERIARHVLGDAHPIRVHIEQHLRKSRAARRESRCPSGEVILYVVVAVFAWLYYLY